MIQYRNVDNWKLINYQGHDIKGVYSSLGKVWPQETPPTPTNYKWLATYSDSHTESEECDSSSAITWGEVESTNLIDVQIGDCVTVIDDGAFEYCHSLSSVTIPNNVITIGEEAFINCDISYLTIGSGVTSIGISAFNGCQNLSSVTIPNSVITIGNNAFDNCITLTSITIGSSVQTIGASAFTWCTSLTSVTIPDSVTTIGDRAFYLNWGVRSLTLGSGVTSIGVGAFVGLTQITSLDIPNSVTSIGMGAFYECTSLTSCTIGSGVTTISDRAFYNFKNISGVTINATTPPTIGTSVFDGEDEEEHEIAYTYPIYVPCQSLAAYQTAWSDYSSRLQCIPTPSYSGQYLTFIAEGNGTFKFRGNSIDYSLDGGATWTTLASNTNSPTVSAGNKILWKATLTPSSSNGIGTFSSTANFTVEGNAMSLLYGDNFREQISLSGKDHAFGLLFSGCTTLTSAENLSLLATTLANFCYRSMFRGCTSLTTAPELPATTLGVDCYAFMFEGCINLTTAPSVLPATTLADSCYLYMFGNCTNLTTAPSLPATTLAESCYEGMFMGCTSLTTAPQLPATTLTRKCYHYMFYSCINLTTTPSVLPATTLAINCYESMFRDCSSLTTAPQLPATTLVTECYLQMFQDCTNLNNITCLATNISASNCTKNWVFGVAANGTFTKASSMNRWGTCGTSKIPCGWTVVDNT